MKQDDLIQRSRATTVSHPNFYTALRCGAQRLLMLGDEDVGHTVKGRTTSTLTSLKTGYFLSRIT